MSYLLFMFFLRAVVCKLSFICSLHTTAQIVSANFPFNLYRLSARLICKRNWAFQFDLIVRWWEFHWLLWIVKKISSLSNQKMWNSNNADWIYWKAGLPERCWHNPVSNSRTFAEGCPICTTLHPHLLLKMIIDAAFLSLIEKHWKILVFRLSNGS